MLVTVITATYMNFSNIERVIKSVLSQSYEQIEYIISDDGSTNFDEKLIKNYIDIYKRDNLKNIIIIHHEKNLGTVKNINHAYQQAQGEIIVQVASDDELYDSNVIERIAERYNRKPFKILLTSRLICDENDNPICVLPHLFERNRIVRLTRKEQYDRFIGRRLSDMATGSAMTLNRDFILKLGGYNEKYKLYEDAPFFAQFLENNQIDVELSIISIRYHLGGISTNKIVNPILQNDMDLYNTTDRIKNLKELSIRSRRCASYECLAIKYRNQKFKKTINKIRFIDVILYMRLLNIYRVVRSRGEIDNYYE